MSDPKDYKTREEAAEYLGLSRWTLEAKRNDPTFPQGVRLGKRVFYRTSDLDTYMANQRKAAGHMSTLMQLREASESRTATAPTRQTLAKAFADVPPLDAVGAAVTSVELDTARAVKFKRVNFEAAEKTLLAQQVLTESQVTVVRRIEDLPEHTGIFHIDDLNLTVVRPKRNS